MFKMEAFCYSHKRLSKFAGLKALFRVGGGVFKASDTDSDVCFTDSCRETTMGTFKAKHQKYWCYI